MLNLRLVATLVVAGSVVVPNLVLADRSIGVSAGRSWEKRAETSQDELLTGGFVALEAAIPMHKGLSAVPFGAFTSFPEAHAVMRCADCFEVENSRALSGGFALRYDWRRDRLLLFGQGGPSYVWDSTEYFGGFAGTGDSETSHHARLQAGLGANVNLNSTLSLGVRTNMYLGKHRGAGLGLSLTVR